jgi:hypothetical protein
MLQLFSEMFDRLLFPASLMTAKENSHSVLDTPVDFGQLSSSIDACVPQMYSEPCQNKFVKLQLQKPQTLPSQPLPFHSLASVTTNKPNDLSSLSGNIGTQCLPLV